MTRLHPHVPSSSDFSLNAVVWLTMMSVMMAPTVWPWVRAFHVFGAGSCGRVDRWIATAAFTVGYFAAWSGYSLAAAAAQQLLARTGAIELSGAMAPSIAAAMLVVAGLFQFASLKRACLTHCRNPMSYFLARWRNGPRGGFRMGFGHGVYCVGCCWALMLTMLAVGVMNAGWMIALTTAVFIEQVLPFGNVARLMVGAALIAGGIATFF